MRFHDAAALEAALEALVDGRRDLARLAHYGRSRAGRPLWCVELGMIDHPQRDRLPALLVVAGLDGHHLVGTELVLDHARLLLEGYGREPAITRLLDEHVLYLLPRANPDGAEAAFATPLREVRGNLRPVDDDRDGRLDEDAPQDLNGDGVITQMRWRDPAGTWIEDPEQQRLLRPADSLKGERGIYKQGVEGVDRDGDGECGEDGAGDVAPNRNFPHRWQEFDGGAGRLPMDEPESLALGQFLFARPAIALALVYGLHDNLAVDAKVDGGDGSGGPGAGGGGGFRQNRTMPGGILKDDGPLYGEVAARYRKLTGVTSKALLDADDGAFVPFSYFQFGVPTFAAHVWSPPLDVKAPDAPKDAKAPEGGEAKLLAWNDHAMGGSAFVPWTRVPHPTLGEVEVGGWRPGVRSNPPLAEVAELARKHGDFLVELGSLFAQLAIGEPKVEPLGGDLFRVTATVVNDGWLPSLSAMGERNRRPRAARLDLDLGSAKLLQGQVRHAWPRIEGGGGRREVKWLLQAEPGTEVLLRLWSERAGDDERAVVLQ